MPIIEMKDVSFEYPNNPVLKNANYEFECGKVYAITGKSGAGKTTLLSLLSGMIEPNSGDILYDGKSIKKTNQFDYRSQQVGIIFQEYNLLLKYTARENIEFAFDISKKKVSDMKDFGEFTDKKAYIDELITKVGLDPNALGDNKILKMSGGQQQRIAIARALSFQPSVILADEPTGNLDIDTTSEIMDIFLELAHKYNRCIIIVTHSQQVADLADVNYVLKPLSTRKEQE